MNIPKEQLLQMAAHSLPRNLPVFAEETGSFEQHMFAGGIDYKVSYSRSDGGKWNVTELIRVDGLPIE